MRLNLSYYRWWLVYCSKWSIKHYYGTTTLAEAGMRTHLSLKIELIPRRRDLHEELEPVPPEPGSVAQVLRLRHELAPRRSPGMRQGPFPHTRVSVCGIWSWLYVIAKNQLKVFASCSFLGHLPISLKFTFTECSGGRFLKKYGTNTDSIKARQPISVNEHKC